VTVTYTYHLDIEIPDAPTGLDLGELRNDLIRAGVNMYGPLTRSVSGEVAVPANVSAEAVREYLVNELCKDYLGKTVTVTRFSLTPA
jgi:hypothetical protein